MENDKFTIFKDDTFIDLALYQFGKEKCKPGHSFGPAARNHYLFHYIFSGKGKLCARNSKNKDEVYELSEGQGFLIFPGQITTYIADDKNPWTYAWVEIDGLLVKSCMELSGFSIDQPVYKSRDKEACEEMKTNLDYLAFHGNESSLNLIGHLYLFIDSLIKSSRSTLNKKRKTLHDYYIKEAINFIELNYQKNISVEEIADVCGINRSYFGKLFHNQMGQSPQEFLLQYRMIKASKLLLLTNKSIEEIGKDVGYESQFHFSRAFKAVYGLSPLKWKKENQPKTESTLEDLF